MTHKEHVKKALEEAIPFVDSRGYGGVAYIMYDALELLKEQEEPVRCKDCAYALFKEGLVPHGHIVCTKPFTERWQVVKPDDWFCGDWKRKEVKE